MTTSRRRRHSSEQIVRRLREVEEAVRLKKPKEENKPLKEVLPVKKLEIETLNLKAKAKQQQCFGMSELWG